MRHDWHFRSQGRVAGQVGASKDSTRMYDQSRISRWPLDDLGQHDHLLRLEGSVQRSECGLGKHDEVLR